MTLLHRPKPVDVGFLGGPVVSAGARRGTARRSNAAYPDRLVEYLFATMMVTWGAWLVNPYWRTFDNPVYTTLGMIADESIWGAFSMFVGTLRLGALVVNGRYCRTPLIRFVGSMFGVTWWMTLTYLFLSMKENNPPAGISFFPVFTLFECFSCWRSMADAFHENSFRPLKWPRILSFRPDD
jgi:hypothetical protein